MSLVLPAVLVPPNIGYWLPASGSTFVESTLLSFLENVISIGQAVARHFGAPNRPGMPAQPASRTNGSVPCDGGGNTAVGVNAPKNSIAALMAPSAKDAKSSEIIRSGIRW